MMKWLLKRNKLKAGKNSILTGRDLYLAKEMTIGKLNLLSPLASSGLVILIIGILFFIYKEPILNSIDDRLTNFCEDELNSVSILVLPFKTYADDITLKTSYQQALVNRINQLSDKEELDLNVKYLKSYEFYPEGKMLSAKKLGKEKCAEIVIWGNVDESTKPAGLEIQLAVIDPTLLKGVSKDEVKIQFGRVGPLELNNTLSFQKIEEVAYLLASITLYNQGHFKKSTDLLSKLKIKPVKEDCESLEMCLQWATIFWYLGSGEKSKEMIDFAQEIQDKKVCSPILQANIYDQIANLYSEYIPDIDSSLKFSKKGIEILSNLSNPQDSLLGILYTNYASTLFSGDKYEEALSAQNKALHYFEKSLKNPFNFLFTTAYANLAYMHGKSGEHNLALSFARSALLIEQKIYPSNHPQIAQTFEVISNLYYELKNCQASLNYSDSALRIRSNYLSSNHIKLGHSYHNRSTIRNNCGTDYSLARDDAHKALAIFESQVVPDTQKLTSVNSQLFSIYRNLNDLKKAKIYLDKAHRLQLINNNGNPLGIRMVYIQNHYSHYYLATRDYDLGLMSSDTAVMILRPYFGKISPKYVSTVLSNKAAFLAYSGECDAALALCDSSMNYMQKSEFGLNNEHYGGIYFTYARAYYCKGDFDRAFNYAQKAFEIERNNLKTKYGSKFTVANIRALIGKIYYEKGDKFLASTWSKEAINLIKEDFPNGHYFIDHIKSDFKDLL